MTPPPVTQVLDLEWSPTLRYYQHRLVAFEQLEASGALEAFRVTPDDLSARLAEGELTLRSRGLRVATAGSPTDPELWGAIDLVREVMQPDLTALRTTYQHMLPMRAADYDEARMVALTRLSGDIMPSLGVHDWSVLLDGRTENTEWQCEFGIISNREATRRLTGNIGRIGVGVPPSVVERVLGAVRPFAFYAQSIWDASNVDEEAVSSAWILDRLNSLSAEAEQVIGRLYEHVAGDPVGTTQAHDSERGAS